MIKFEYDILFELYFSLKICLLEANAGRTSAGCLVAPHRCIFAQLCTLYTHILARTLSL